MVVSVANFSLHGIAFGEDADYTLVRKISARNNGLARKLYEDSDAAEQLKGCESLKLSLKSVERESCAALSKLVGSS